MSDVKTYTLLEDTTHETSSLLGAILKCCRSSVTVEAAHGNTEERTACQELLVSITETGSLLHVSDCDFGGVQSREGEAIPRIELIPRIRTHDEGQGRPRLAKSGGTEFGPCVHGIFIWIWGRQLIHSHSRNGTLSLSWQWGR